MSCIERHSQALRQRGYRITPQRLAILEALHHEGHLSPAQVYERVRQTGLTEATVYRTLEFLRANSIVFAAQREGGHLTYELAGASHHHLICRICGAQVDLEAAALQKLIASLEEQSGYRLDASHLTLFGLCPNCQASRDSESETRSL